jgi:hypothetical protein
VAQLNIDMITEPGNDANQTNTKNSWIDRIIRLHDSAALPMRRSPGR